MIKLQIQDHLNIQVNNNSKFQVIWINSISQITKATKFGRKQSCKLFHPINNHKNLTQKEEIKIKATFQNSFFLSFVLFCLYSSSVNSFGSKDKRERTKEKEGRGFGRSLYFFISFFLVLYDCYLDEKASMIILVQFWSL